MIQRRLVVVVIIEEEENLVQLGHIDFSLVDGSSVEEFLHLGFAASCVPVDDITYESSDEG